MNFMSLVKRVAPFVVTLAVGLFIASFFVNVSAPNFKFKGKYSRHREYDRQRENRIKALEAENQRLNDRVKDLESRDWVLEQSIDVPPPTMPMKTVPSKSR